MPLDFPTSPALNEIYTFGGRSWQWNGTAWDVYSTVSGNVVTQLNGLTGGVTLAAGSNITLTPTGNTITIASSGGGGGGISGPYVISFNGLTGAVTGVSSIRGLTGAVGITNGSGIGLSVSGQTMTFSNTGVLSIDGGTGAITNVARTNIDNNFSASQSIVTSPAIFTVNDTGSLKDFILDPDNNVLAFGDFGNYLNLYFPSLLSSSETITFPNFTTTLAGLSGTQTFTGIKTFNALTNFPGGISGAGATFTGNISAPNIVNSINGKTGAINLVAGSGITLALSGNTFTISSTATSGGGGTYYNFTQSSSAPAGPTAGDRWFDTNTGKFFTAITDSGNNIWIESGGVAGGQAGCTATIDFSETINYLKVRVFGLGTDYSTSLSIFNTLLDKISSVFLSTTVTSNAITIDNIVEYSPFYDGLTGWVLDITAKPPFGGNKTAAQLVAEPFDVMDVTWNPSPSLQLQDFWYTFGTQEVIDKEGTYVVKGITGQSWVAADSFISCKVMGLTSADHTAEDAILEGVQFEINNINPGVGFDIIGHAPNGTYGKYAIKCLGQ